MTLNQLRECSCKQLAEMAKRGQIAGWHAMRKEELVDALHRMHRNRKRQAARRNGHSKSNGESKKGRHKKNGRSGANGTPALKVQRSVAHRNGSKAARTRRSRQSTLPLWIASIDTDEERPTGLFAVACDCRWIHVNWCLSPPMVERALAALGPYKHTAVPMLRVLDATRNDHGTRTESVVDEFEIGEDLDNWYVRIDDPARTYKIHIGLKAADGRFATIARSRCVQLPRTEQSGAPKSWGTRGAGASSLGRPKSSGAAKHCTNGNGANGNTAISGGDFQFNLDAELIVHGNTHPQAELTLFGEPVPLREDGSFSLRVRVPEGRQVIPAQAVTPNRSERRTIVLSLERNTKELEPQSIEDSA